jgi:hypothetical protein
MNSANLQFDVTNTRAARDQFENLISMLAKAMPNASISVSIYATASETLQNAIGWEAPPREIKIDLDRVNVNAIVEDVVKTLDQTFDDPYRDQLEAITRAELNELLNRYTAKHPKKAVGTREMLTSFGGERLSEINEDQWPQIAKTARAYLDQVK